MNTILQNLQHHASVLPPPLQAELLNYAIYLQKKAKARPTTPVSEHTRRRLLTEALENAVALNSYRDIKDPVAWQREQRQDRPLPGRTHAD
ncbi:DUF2281 domain-containing protein [Thiorhodovibrio frisius]|uniref:DUF2281 domain-containing protein n=1 Tax=Thiorhodovibrio frisius TaxID=631362 RepID=H8Z0H8_9GAMM|nr:DUF2281 domain-containing protein [Thiorhodovibrio frisius]EIC21279.1 Protein of unknown function (DUF2281) [Thiorhodovibrio frisius]WPL23857.1 hypothetical protein Thiofri_04063 [Thiorhodovibrio frisius]